MKNFPIYFGGAAFPIEKLYKIITRLSPVAWRHINLYGNYEFSKALTLLDLQKIIDQMSLAQ
jgi:hypothetical protein